MCSGGATSSNKGKACASSTDCPTSISGQYTACRCGLNNNGQKYCDAEGGDQEWVAARDAVCECFDSRSF